MKTIFDAPKIFDYIGHTTSLIGLAQIFFNNDTRIEIKIIICLSSVLVAFICYMISLSIKYKMIKKNYMDIEQRHNALSIQFDEKKEAIVKYENAFALSQQVLVLALSRMKDANLKEVYKTISMIFDETNKGGKY